MILGTHAEGNDPNYLMVAKVRLPNDNAEIDMTKYDSN